jgi:predicted enzyme related to lactoylglutathione lyase
MDHGVIKGLRQGVQGPSKPGGSEAAAGADPRWADAQRILRSVDAGDVDDLVERVEALGGRALCQPHDMPWGQQVAHRDDPDGNAVNLTQPI